MTDETCPTCAAEALLGHLRRDVAFPVVKIDTVTPATAHDQVCVLWARSYVPAGIAAARAATWGLVEADGIVAAVAGEGSIDII